jgi:hypothetical protein
MQIIALLVHSSHHAAHDLPENVTHEEPFLNYMINSPRLDDTHRHTNTTGIQ